MRIALVIPTLNGGGAERVMSTMANYWESTDHEVILITHDSEKKDFYPLSPGVTRYGFDISKPPRHIGDTIKHNIQRVTLPRKVIQTCHPDIVISFTNRTSIQTLAGLSGTEIPVIVSERNNPVAQPLPLPWEMLRRTLYPKASAVVVQTPSVKEWALRFLAEDRVSVIPNPLSPPSMQEIPPELPSRLNGKKIVAAMGRLHHFKGFDILLQAFSAVARKRSNWALMILGDGDERFRLEQMALQLGIQDRVFLAGRVHNPTDYLRASDIFVLSSRHEGFPNALIEAMASGLPSIAADCPFGPGDIISNGIDGILVKNEDIHELSRAIDHLMGNDHIRKSMGSMAKQSSTRYNIDTIMAQWEDIIARVIHRYPIPEA
jgi:glycosyltransferase involved in cell wall biosynthesis